MRYIGEVVFYWANPTRQQQDEGNYPTIIYKRIFNTYEDALTTVKNKAKQQSIGILKANWNKYKQLPICRYFVKIENSWLVAEGKAKQGVLFEEWEDDDQKISII